MASCATLSAAEPYWSVPPLRQCVALPSHADVVVVGGGITGVSAVHWLAQRGVPAVLLERERLAAGASGRNAGFLLMGVAANYAMAVRTYGRDVAREVWHFTAENHALLAEILGGHGADYARRGSLTLAATAEEASLLRESETLLREDDLPGGWVDADGGLFNPADGELHPAAAVGVIADAAVQRGAVIVEGAGVVGVEAGAGGGDLRVHTGGGEMRAGAVILATNAYMPELAATLPVTAVRAQMLATAPASQRVAGCPVYSNFGHRYWRQRDDGGVLLGGWRDTAVEEEVGFEAVPTPTVQRHLDAHLADMGVTAAVTHRWAGIMGFTPDELPLVGPVPSMPGVFACGGYTGHGMGFAAHATLRLVQHIIDSAPIPAWLRADR